MAQEYVGPADMNINEVTICDGFINFTEVSKAVGRIAPVIRNIEGFGTVQKANVEKFRGIGNWFEPIEINEETMIVMGSDVFWACVCLDQKRVFCKRSQCPSTRNIVNYRISATDGDVIPQADRQNYRQRIDRVCNSQKPPLRVEWPGNW